LNLKAKAVLKILREEDTISQIASKYEVHPNLLNKWRKAVIEGLPRRRKCMITCP
jgi:transposase-like protein